MLVLNLHSLSLFHLGAIKTFGHLSYFIFRKGIMSVAAILFISFSAQAQFFTPSDTLNKKRLVFATTTTAVGYGATVIGLNELWYKDYPRSDFHFFNDNAIWMQMDKAGHALTSYQLGRAGYEVMKWTGTSDKSALWIGGNLGLFFLTTVEIMDGYSDEWGFSTGDALANLSGTGLFIGQELLWNEQRMSLKFSYSPSEYAQYRPETLGSTGLESMLKDYNGQTIWLSVNPSSFGHKEKPFLPWLNVALGYGANGMLGGDCNPPFNQAGDALPEIERYRQYYLSLDIDLSQIKTENHFLKTVFSVVGFIKIPAPAIEFSQGDVKWHWLAF